MPKRGLIVLVFVWCVLLLTPALQMQTRKMIQTSHGGGFVNMLGHMGRADWPELAKTQPGNGQIAFRSLRASGDAKKPQYWRDLDDLLARFPNDLNLRRARLMESTRSNLVRPIYTTENGKPDPDALLSAEKWQNQAQREALAKAARVGETQAPDDGFFPWMEAMALWNRDDEAALQALARAAKLTNFDDGVIANQRGLLRLKNAQNPLEWDEKIAIIYGSSFSHFALMRNLAREVTQSGIAHYRRGDKAGAYRRWRLILQASGAFRRSQNHGPQSTVISILVGESLQRAVWQTVATELKPTAKVEDMSGNPRPPLGNENASDPQTKKIRLLAFEALARRDGQGDLAAYVARENASFEGRKLSAQILDSYDKLGLGSTVALGGLELVWVGNRVFWLSIVGGLGLLACLIWRFRIGGAHWFRASSSQIAFFGTLWLCALALGLWSRVASQLQVMNGGDESQLTSSLLFNSFNKPWVPWLAIAATLALSVGFVYWGDIRETSRLQQQVTPRDNAATSGAWLPKLTAIAWIMVLISTLFWFAVSSDENYNSLARGIWIVCSLLALGLSLWRIERGESIGKARSRLALVSAVFGLISLGLTAQSGLSSEGDALYVASISLLLALAILIYLTVNSRSWRSLLPRAIAVALQTLGGVATLCTVALLIASLAALPVRARQNRIMDDYIARGEIDWMRSQMPIRKTVGK